MGMTMGKPQRSRNPRPLVLGDLRKIKRWTQYMINTWAQSLQVWDEVRDWTDSDGVVRRNIGPRPMRDDEKPENRIKDWHELIHYMGAVRRQADEIQSFAWEQIERLKDEQAGAKRAKGG